MNGAGYMPFYDVMLFVIFQRWCVSSQELRENVGIAFKDGKPYSIMTKGTRYAMSSTAPTQREKSYLEAFVNFV